MKKFNRGLILISLEMVYLHLLAAFGLFTLLDALITVVGLEVGCVELNPIITIWGVPFWVMFRILLLVCMLTVFLFGYDFCLNHANERSLWMLEKTIIILDFYIGIVVLSGFFSIILKLFL